MPQKSKVRSSSEIFRGLAGGLRTAATRPNVYGYKPHEKQVKFHSSQAKGRLFLGGNRSGKTVGGAVEAVWWLTGKHPYIPTPPPPVRGRCVSVDFLNGVAKIVKPEIARWLPLSELKGGSWEAAYDKELRTLELENGSTLEFMSYDQELEKFAGTSRHFVWFDEEPPHDIFTENKMRLIDTGGRWWITMTPVEGMTWVYDDIYMASKTDPNLAVTVVDMTENVYLNAGEIDDFMHGLSQDERSARIHGKFVQIGGLIYKKFSEINLVDPGIEIPKSWLHVAALDHGFNNPTAWLWAGVDPDGRIIVFDEHYESGQIVSYHAAKVQEKNRQHGREPDYYVGDPSIRNTDPITGTSVQLEYIECGIPVMLGNNDVRAGINRVAQMLEGYNGVPRLYIARNCVNLVYEIQRYRWGQWATKKMQFDKNKKEEPHKKADHACDALRYLVASRPQVDDGHVVPESQNYLGAAIPVLPEQTRFDEGSQIPQNTVDAVLGAEW